MTASTQSHGEPSSRRGLLGRVMLVVTGLALILGFSALGVWQVQRLVWKTELIAQVGARIHAAPTPAPGPADWPAVTRENDQYRRVSAHGVFLHDRETLVQAVTEAGPGFWVLTPLKVDRGFTVLVNRGFVPADRRDQSRRREGLPVGRQQVVGLLRITEPKGGFLRANDPANDLWRSRDVAAIGAHRGLDHLAPYFLDADSTANPGGWPRGGMTVVKFANSHLVYAITWFALALGVALALGFVLRTSRHGEAP